MNRLRRSVLYMPASNARALEKARGLAADALIFDLEDAVAPEAKAAARALAVQAANTRGYGDREIVIRVNGTDTPWGAEDIAAVASCACDAVLFPKVDSAELLREAVLLLDRAGGTAQRVWAMLETPFGVLHAEQIAGASPRLDVLVMGTADLSKALRVDASMRRVDASMPRVDASMPRVDAWAPRTGLLSALGHCLIAARARGLDILDGVFTDIADEAGFAESCRQGRVLGFDGKTLIHPQQIATTNRVFGVSAEEAAAAAEVIAAWDAAAKSGQGIAVLRGRMIERLHADEARRIVATHRAIQASGDPRASADPFS